MTSTRRRTRKLTPTERLALDWQDDFFDKRTMSNLKDKSGLKEYQTAVTYMAATIRRVPEAQAELMHWAERSGLLDRMRRDGLPVDTLKTP